MRPHVSARAAQELAVAITATLTRPRLGRPVIRPGARRYVSGTGGRVLTVRERVGMCRGARPEAPAGAGKEGGNLSRGSPADALDCMHVTRRRRRASLAEHGQADAR